MKQQQYNTALYMRLSRDDELEGESASISTQKQILRDYANEQGFTVVDEYVDDGFSGTNFERPSFKRMIDDIEDGKINCVITKRFIKAWQELYPHRAIYGALFPKQGREVHRNS